MKAIRKAQVFYNDDLAGYLTETESGYSFGYDAEFLKKNIMIAASFPLRQEPFQSRELFAFFKGLLPEGWYLEIVCATQKIDSKDYFGLLIGTASLDTAGAVTVKKVEASNG